ncbi:MAG: nickel-binding protein [Thermoplasmata archaeon]
MPKYIDSHPMGTFSPGVLRTLQKSPEDEFGITHHDILFNSKEDRVYCVLDAPSRDAVAKHHAKAGITCDFIQEVASARS